MIFNEVTKLKKFEKTVIDFLLYVEKETNILFDHSTLEGIFAWVTTDTQILPSRTICMPAEFYRLYSKNYYVQFIIRYCPCECCEKIINVELIPSSSFYEEDMYDATMLLEEIFPDISISPFVPNYGYIYYE